MNLKLAWTVGLLTVAFAIGGLASVSAQHPYTTQSKEQEKIFFLPRDRPKTGVGWEITTTSASAEIALARHLANTGAKEYVAWWCPDCHEQKLLFGKEAYQIISDSIKVECDQQRHQSTSRLVRSRENPWFSHLGHQWPPVQPCAKSQGASLGFWLQRGH